ncbi:hypothetical protein HPB52_004514 [Rhipicephalus sanguineus]|uniref:CCHC-type domain-containing protein n=1 Tax=Rhipicephalus sanguineus TaxID=34632 RepID=A0A9D4Q793_RHISA|nr:hypothetical protein HPB52_004514 [Rhipicephalus sanguineus]
MGRQYNRDVVKSSEVNSVTIGSDISALRELIRAVIKEELQKMQMTAPPVGQLSVAEIIRVEVRHAVHAPQHYEVPHQRQCVEMSYAEAVRPPPPCSTPGVVHPAQKMEDGFSRHNPPLIAEATPRESDLWRTPDRRPLRLHCGEPGHIYRACPYRRVGLRGFSPNAPRPRPGERPLEIENFISNRRNVEH